MVAQRLLIVAAACAILIFFAPESRKSQCGFGFGSVSVSNICYRPGSVYVRLRFLPFLVGFGSVWCLEHSILIDILEGFLIYICGSWLPALEHGKIEENTVNCGIFNGWGDKGIGNIVEYDIFDRFYGDKRSPLTFPI